VAPSIYLRGPHGPVRGDVVPQYPRRLLDEDLGHALLVVLLGVQLFLLLDLLARQRAEPAGLAILVAGIELRLLTLVELRRRSDSSRLTVFSSRSAWISASRFSR